MIRILNIYIIKKTVTHLYIFSFAFHLEGPMTNCHIEKLIFFKQIFYSCKGDLREKVCTIIFMSSNNE